MKGFWIGKGYGCGGRSNIPEDINVEFVNGEFVATKVNGDDCVPSGNVTFRGKLPDNWETNKQYPGIITLGNPARPASGSGSCRIVPIEKDKFRVVNWNLEFVRGRLNPPAEEPKKEEPKKEEPVKEEPKKEEPKKEEPKKEEPKKEEPKIEKPCPSNNNGDHLPRGNDDEDVYTKHIDIVEKYRKAKNPYKKYGNGEEDDDLVLVPRRWLKVPEHLREREDDNGNGRGNRGRNPNRRPNPRREEDDDDYDDEDDEDDDDYDSDDNRRCRFNRRRRGLRLEN